MNCPVKVRHQSNFYGGFFMAKVNAEQRILLQSQTNEGKIKRPKPGGIPNSGLRSRLTKYV